MKKRIAPLIGLVIAAFAIPVAVFAMSSDSRPARSDENGNPDNGKLVYWNGPYDDDHPTSQPEGSGMEGFRVFAPRIQQALDERDTDFFLGRVFSVRHDCTKTDVNFGILSCRQVGQTLEGVWVGPGALSGCWHHRMISETS